MTGLIFYVMSDFLFQIENRGPDIDADRIIPFHSERTSFQIFFEKIPARKFSWFSIGGYKIRGFLSWREQFGGKFCISRFQTTKYFPIGLSVLTNQKWEWNLLEFSIFIRDRNVTTPIYKLRFWKGCYLQIFSLFRQDSAWILIQLNITWPNGQTHHVIENWSPDWSCDVIIH